MRGRDSCFRCIYCERFVSYDMRKTGKNYRTESYFSLIEEQYFPEEIVEFYHKKCKHKTRRKECQK